MLFPPPQLIISKAVSQHLLCVPEISIYKKSFPSIFSVQVKNQPKSFACRHSKNTAPPPSPIGCRVCRQVPLRTGTEHFFSRHDRAVVSRQHIRIERVAQRRTTALS